MATAGEMTRVFADALKLTEANVALRYRALREAGLVAKAARGRYTPDRSSQEAARLLIAVMGAQSVVDVAPAVWLLGGLKADGAKGTKSTKTDFGSVVFERAVEMVLEDCYAHSIGEEPSNGIGRGFLTVAISQTHLTATVESGGLSASYSIIAGVEAERAFPENLSEAVDRFLRNFSAEGLSIEARVGGVELMQLSQALKPTNG